MAFGFKKTAGNMRGALERFRGRFGGGMNRLKAKPEGTPEEGVQPKARGFKGGWMARFRKPDQAEPKGPQPTKKLVEE